MTHFDDENDPRFFSGPSKLRMPTPIIITLPIHTIEQARALAGLLRAFIDGQQPDTNEGADWKPDPDLAGMAALFAHLDAGIAAVTKLRLALDTGLGEHIDRDVPLYPDHTDQHGATLDARMTWHWHQTMR